MNEEDLEARARRSDGRLKGVDKFVGESKFDLGDVVATRGTTARVDAISKCNSKFIYRLRPEGGGPNLYVNESELESA